MALQVSAGFHLLSLQVPTSLFSKGVLIASNLTACALPEGLPLAFRLLFDLSAVPLGLFEGQPITLFGLPEFLFQ